MSNNMENMLMNMNDSDSDSDEDHNTSTTHNDNKKATTAVVIVQQPPVSAPLSAPITTASTSNVPTVAAAAVTTNVSPMVSVPHDTSIIDPIPVAGLGKQTLSVQPIGPPPGTAIANTNSVSGTMSGTTTSISNQYHTGHTTSQVHAPPQPQQQQPRVVPFDSSIMDIEPTPLRDLQATAQSSRTTTMIQPPSSSSSIHTTTAAPSTAIATNTSNNRSNVNHPMHAQALRKPHMAQPTHPTTTTTTSSSSLPITDHKSRKEQFLMFTRVLMKYLDKQDPNMHTRAKQVIRECAQKNRNGDPGYSSLSISMQKRLKTLVGNVYWHKATEYLAKYFKDQYMKTGRLTEDQARRKAHEYARLAASDLSMDYNNPNTTNVPSSGSYMSSSMMTAANTNSSTTTSAMTTGTSDKSHNRIVPPPILTNVAKLQSSKRSMSMTPTTATEKKKKTYTKKGSASNTPTPSTTHGSTATTTAAAVAAAAATKEYNELMEMVHHVVDYDVKSCGLILNHEIKGELNLTQEQKQLVYGDFGIQRDGKGARLSKQTKGLYSGPQSAVNQMKLIPSYMKGWGSRNVLSARAAWAKLRLEEDLRYELEQSSLLLPGVEPNTDETMTTTKDPYEWFNEEEAEEDDTLALLSEATQYYLRTILQGAMHAASQRLNIDGIRLWHTQHQAADKGAKQESIPFSLRLGCDVQRQVALVQGNAAKTCQRMEEALSRSSESKGDIDYDVLCNTSSMMELSKIPVISTAATKAEECAKRSFEIYGGKSSGDPPFGRVPKKAKITLKDLNVCVSNHAFAVKKKGFLYRLH